MTATEAQPLVGHEPVEAPATFSSADFPLNAWYAAAWDVELKRELLPRTICGHNLVFYRKLDGEPVALENACWHRLLPLSKGELHDDNVMCGYHGLVYNPRGRCIHMPSQRTINPAAQVKSYPVIERHRYLWVWMGDPALADPDAIPDLHWNDDPDWAGDGETIHALCNYKLVIDNLMDLTHETYVHGGSIGNRHVAEAPFDVTHEPGKVILTRWMLDSEPPPFWAKQLGSTDNVDRWQICHFTAPSTIAIDVGVAPTGTGAPEGDRSQGVNGWVINTMTPETDRTCHYFWSFARNHHLDEQKWTTEIRQGVRTIFREDEDILAAQQEAIEQNPDKVFYNLNLDAGAMWARRLIDEMVAKES
jgi:vanillate O-demethylase monooxygenase subunit